MLKYIPNICCFGDITKDNCPKIKNIAITLTYPLLGSYNDWSNGRHIEIDDSWPIFINNKRQVTLGHAK